MQYLDTRQPNFKAENAHRWVKYHCTAARLQFYKF